MKLILASASPRRVEILSKLEVSFSTKTSKAEEELSLDLRELSPEKRVEVISFIKASDIAKKLCLYEGGEVENVLVVGADTIVTVDGEVLEKPKDKEDARRMIGLIRGREHEVYTGVSLIKLEAELFTSEGRAKMEEVFRFLDGESCTEKKNKLWLQEFEKAGKVWLSHFEEVTKVMVDELSWEEVEAYISTEEPYDKAGAYAIQGGFSKFIRGIEGDYYNVMGFPLSRLYKELKPFLKMI